MKSIIKQFRFPLLSLAITTASILLVLSGFKTVHTQKTKESKGVNWYEFQEGYDLAVKESKPLLIDMYTDWCGYCRKMDKTTYSNARVVELINNHFIAVKFNPEKNGKFAVGKKIMTHTELKYWLGNGKAYGYPTTYFWMEPYKNQKITLELGYKDKKEFINILENYLGIGPDSTSIDTD